MNHPLRPVVKARLRWVMALLLSATAVSGRAETLVLPVTLANRDMAFGAGTLSAGAYRSQQVYGAQHFPSGSAFYITELRFRPDHFYGKAFTTAITSLQVLLSTTARSPDGLSSIFAQNIGSDETLVFDGAIVVSSQFIGPVNGPKEFDISIPLSTPFLYNPVGGHLLLDIRNLSGSTASALSGEAVSGDAASRVGGSLHSTSGGIDTGIDALQIVYSITNPPPPPPRPTRLLRGPYLQHGTPTNILVQWRSDPAGNGVVRFGLAPEALNWSVTGAAYVADQIVGLTNLLPSTKYFYSIGTAETNLAGGADYFFTTAPTNAKPTRIWAIGDAGVSSLERVNWVKYGQQEVRDAYYAHTGARSTDVWLMLGDNAYGNGLDDEYQTNMFDIYPTLLRQSVAWSTIGNHDVPGPYYDIFSFPRNGEAGGVASGNEAYYSFDYGNIHFVCLDAEVASRQPDGPMLTWLQQDLAANTKDWTIAFWHEPPYSKGSHNSDINVKMTEMRQYVVPILEAYGVDLVLCGHSHVYERSFLLNGHYGLSPSFQPIMALDGGSGRPGESGAYLKANTGPQANQGAVYVVAGSSGWVWPDQGLNHPAMFTGLRELGSMVIDIDGNRLDAKFLRENGVIDDHFTIIKGAILELLRFATFRVFNGTVTAQFKSEAGRRYQVERTLGLETPQWSPAGAEILATGATTTWTQPIAPGGGNSFYRVVQVN